MVEEHGNAAAGASLAAEACCSAEPQFSAPSYSECNAGEMEAGAAGSRPERPAPSVESRPEHWLQKHRGRGDKAASVPCASQSIDLGWEPIRKACFFRKEGVCCSPTSCRLQIVRITVDCCPALIFPRQVCLAEEPAETDWAEHGASRSRYAATRWSLWSARSSCHLDAWNARALRCSDTFVFMPTTPLFCPGSG